MINKNAMLLMMTIRNAILLMMTIKNAMLLMMTIRNAMFLMMIMTISAALTAERREGNEYKVLLGKYYEVTHNLI